MLGLALWAFAAAYGRMTRELTPLPFAILIGIALLTTYLTSGIVQAPFVVQFAINAGGFILFFAIGHVAGRWLDRDKYQD